MSFNQGNNIGSSLAGLGDFLKGLGDLNDPDRTRRNLVQQQIAEDPTKAQEYSQLSPEALRALVGSKAKFGKNKTQELIDSIKNTPLTGKRLEEKNQANAIRLAETNNANAEDKTVLNPFEAYKASQRGLNSVTQNPFDALPQSQNNGTDMLTNNTTAINGTPIAPTLKNKQAEDVRRKALKLPTADEEAANAQRLENEKTLGDTAKLNLQTKQADELTKSKAEIYLEKNKISAYRASLDPNLDPEIRRGLFLGEATLKDIQAGHEERFANATVAHEHVMENLAKDAQSNKHNHDLIYQTANAQTNASLATHIGVKPEVIEDIQDHPEVRAIYQAPGFVPKTPKDEIYKTAVDGLNALGGRIGPKEIAKFHAQFATLEKDELDKVSTDKITPTEAEQNINILAKTVYGGAGLQPPVIRITKNQLFPSFDSNTEGGHMGDIGVKAQIVDPGDVKLGLKNEAPLSAEEKNQAAQIQALIDKGADYESTVINPRAAKFRHLLHPTKVEKK